ncbi:MAG: type II secretion system F family protein [Stenomitos rutilans HA7619-LM2]|jgi:type II secretory pathway component PulF|nr:type II secretion system F family protein [Stenomitos rutilans HA7619-LM2]
MLENARFFHQFAALLNAGIPVQQSLGMAGKDGSATLQRILKEASLKIEMGQDLATSLEGRSPYFDGWTIALIRSAEYSGSLADTFERLAIGFETESKRLLLYRSVLLQSSICFMGVTALLSVVLPKEAMTWLTFGIMFCALFFFAHIATAGAGVVLYQVMSKIPLLKRIAQVRSLLYFTELELPLRCGVPILQALELIRLRIPDLALRQSLAIAARQIQAGQSLSQSLEGKLPPLALQMLRTGEETGNLDEMLGKLSAYYESDLERQLKQLEAMLRPLSILAAGFFVLLIGVQAITSLLNALPD